jgi:hypothetical protein
MRQTTPHRFRTDIGTPARSKHGVASTSMMSPEFLRWLMAGALGPATFGLPVVLAGEGVARKSKAFLDRAFGTDEWTIRVDAIAGAASVNLTRAETKRVGELLQNAETWALIGEGVGPQLGGVIDQVVDCLAESRHTKDGVLAARQIVAALLSHALHDLDEAGFRAVVLARIGSVATSVDELLSSFRTDVRRDLAESRTLLDDVRRLIDQHGLVEHAGPAVIQIYLLNLIRAMNHDLLSQSATGTSESPAAIERHLQLQAGGGAESADDVVDRCDRVVVLGGPGTGKSWFAKRTARLAAERALEALAAGTAIGSVELPLYATCASFFVQATALGAPLGLAKAALASIDLEAGDAFSALERHLQESTSTLVVLDGLDEASATDSRRLASLTETGQRRLLLTSRPSSGRNALTIDEKEPRHAIGDLLPLSYPDDVRAVISSRLADSTANALIQRIDGDRRLQEAAQVPLICAFYCLIGSDGPLPETRRALYKSVVDRLLAGEWRNEPPANLTACVRALSDLAAHGAVDDERTGLAAWTPEIEGWTPPATLTEKELAALSHVAPSTSADATRAGKRTFLHQSLREHLVAEYVARLSVSEAAAVLLPHLWFDPFWEYAAPAAIAAHPNRDQVLSELLRQAAGGRAPAEITQVDGFLEIQTLLCRLAGDSRPVDWTDDNRRMIESARLNLTSLVANVDAFADVVVEGRHWEETSNQIRTALVAQLPACEPHVRVELRRYVSALGPGAYDRGADLLAELQQANDEFIANELAQQILEVGPDPASREAARTALISHLATASFFGLPLITQAVVKMEPSAAQLQSIRELLIARLGGSSGQEAVGALVILSTTNRERNKTRTALIAALPEAGVRLAAQMADAIAALGPRPQETANTRDALLIHLNSAPGSLTAEIVGSLVRLPTPPGERHQTRDALLAFLPEASNSAIGPVAAAIATLEPTPAQLDRTRSALRARVRHAFPFDSIEILRGLVALARSSLEHDRIRSDLVIGLDDVPAYAIDRYLALLISLDPVAVEFETIRAKAVARLPEVYPGGVTRIAETLASLGPTSVERQALRKALVSDLNNLPNEQAEFRNFFLVRLAGTLARLDSEAAEREAMLAALMTQLGESRHYEAVVIAQAMAVTSETDIERKTAREALLAHVREHADDDHVMLIESLASLVPTMTEAVAAVLSMRDGAACAGILGPGVRRSVRLEEWLSNLPMAATVSQGVADQSQRLLASAV